MAKSCSNFRSEALMFICDLLEGDVAKKICQAAVNTIYNEQSELSLMQKQIVAYWRKNLSINGFPKPLNFKKIGRQRLCVCFLSEIKKRDVKTKAIMDFWADMYPKLNGMFLEEYSDHLVALRKKLHQSETEPISKVLEDLRGLALDFSQSISSDSGLSREEILILAVIAGFEEIEKNKTSEKD